MDKFQYNMTVLNVEHLKHVISEENKNVCECLEICSSDKM
jgi:hypothetical protein